MNKNLSYAHKGKFACFLAMDAFVYVFLIYKLIEIFLLFSDRVILPDFSSMRFIVLSVCALIVLNKIYAQWLQKDFRRVFLIEIFTAAFLIALPVALYFLPVKKGATSIWLPLEWHKLPKNFFLMAEISPFFFWGGVASFFLFINQLVKGRKMNILYGTLLIFIVLVLYRLPYIPEKAGRYFAAFGIPFVITLIASITLSPRLFARSYLVSFLGFMIFGHYVGLLPVFVKNDLKNEKAVTKIYPLHRASSAFPLIFMREFYVDVKRNYLFTSYGPASGLVRINLKNGKADKLVHHGLIRYIYSQDNTNFLYALDWDKGDFIVVQKEPFYIKKRTNILTHKLIAPWAFSFYKNNVYVTFHERASLVKYQLRPFKRLREMYFKELNFTHFNSGALKCVMDEKNKKLFVELGMVDLKDRFLLLKIDLKTFTVENKATIPEGGLELLFLKNKNSIIAASFFSDNFYEYDAGTLKLKRVFKGPLNSRNVAYDEDRDYLYATSFLGGKLYVMRYDDAKPVKEIHVGKKSSSLFYDKKNDVLFLGSSLGVFKIHLKTFLEN